MSKAILATAAAVALASCLSEVSKGHSEVCMKLSLQRLALAELAMEEGERPEATVASRLKGWSNGAWITDTTFTVPVELGDWSGRITCRIEVEGADTSVLLSEGIPHGGEE